MAFYRIIFFLLSFCTYFTSYGEVFHAHEIGYIEDPWVVGSAKGVNYTIPAKYRSQFDLPLFVDSHQLNVLQCQVRRKEATLSKEFVLQIKEKVDKKSSPILRILDREATKQLLAKYKQFYPLTYKNHTETYMGKEKFLKELESAKEFVRLLMYDRYLEGV